MKGKRDTLHKMDVVRIRLARRWLRMVGCITRRLPAGVLIAIVSVILGVMTGTATFLLKRVLHHLKSAFAIGMNTDRGNIIYLFLPIVGITLTMVYQRYVLRQNIARGTYIIKRDLVKGHYRLRPDLMYASLFGCATTIGFGGSAGSEGPSAYTGAAIGSNIGRMFRLSKPWMRIVLGCGAGAGIAGIFKSPMGGILFTLEVLHMELNTIPVMALVISCLTASTTAYAWSGFRYDVYFRAINPFDAAHLPWMIVLGLICGLYCIYYNYSKGKSEHFFIGLSNQWTRALIAGAFLALSIYLFPSLYGEGYGVVDGLINNHADVLETYSPFRMENEHMGMLMLGIIGVLCLKGMLVAATNSGGGVAGDFAPTLFAGAMLGYLFGLEINVWFDAGVSAGDFALLGMAAVMSGAIKAPLMAIFITAEMTNTYPFMLGFMVVGAISYGMVKICTPKAWREVSDPNRTLLAREQKDTPEILPNRKEKLEP